MKHSIIAFMLAGCCFAEGSEPQVPQVVEQVKTMAALDSWAPRFDTVWSYWAAINQGFDKSAPPFHAAEFEHMYVVARFIRSTSGDGSFDWAIQPIKPPQSNDHWNFHCRLAYIGKDGKPCSDDFELPDERVLALRYRAEFKAANGDVYRSEQNLVINRRRIPNPPKEAKGLMCALSYHLNDKWLGRGQVLIPLQ